MVALSQRVMSQGDTPAVRPLGDDITEHGINRPGIHPSAKGTCAMQAETPCSRRAAVHAVFALPVDRLVRIEVAGVIESSLDLNDLTELTALCPLDHLLAGGEEREFAGAAAEDLRMIF